VVARAAAIKLGVHLPHLIRDSVPAQSPCNSLSVHRPEECVEVKIDNLSIALFFHAIVDLCTTLYLSMPSENLDRQLYSIAEFI